MTSEHLTVADVAVEVVRKPIRNLHLAVYPPDGRVRVSAPESMSLDEVRAAVVTRLAWVRRRQRETVDAARQSPREMVSGESHFFAGRRYLLRVEPGPGPTRVELADGRTLTLTVGPRATLATRQEALAEFYRAHLKAIVPEMVDQWSQVLDVAPATFHIQSMRTRWGTAHPDRHRIVLNLELAKQPQRCVEYVVVHELAHLVDRTHSKTFQALMDEHLPDWRARRDELNAAQVLWPDDDLPAGRG